MFARSAGRHSRCLRRLATQHRSSDIWDSAVVHQNYSASPFSTTSQCNAARPAPRGKAPGSFAKVRFSPMEVPQLAFWENMARPPLVSGLDPTECFKAAHTYVDLAIADRPGWRNTLRNPPHSLSYEMLHYLAAMIMAGSPGPAFQIALHIYQTLVSLDYAPTVLTFTRLATLRGMLHQPQFQPTAGRFSALARRRDDPNACTLQGLILASELTPEAVREALEWFRAAAELGGEEPGSWQWQATCALEMGKVYKRLGEPQRAMEIWKYCAETLDTAEGYWLYSTMLDDAHPEKYTCVRKAAISGIKDAAREMARLEGARAKQQGDEKSGAWERKKASLLQREWEAIAGDRAIS